MSSWASEAEMDPEGAGNWRLSADHIPQSWTLSLSLKGTMGKVSLFPTDDL